MYTRGERLALIEYVCVSHDFSQKDPTTVLKH
jgi:hypothetical protein